MVPEKVNYRPFRAKDALNICELIGQTFKKDYGEQGLDIYKFEKFLRLLGIVNTLLRKIRLEFCDFYVAEQEGKIIGSIGTYLITRKAWHLGFAAVATEYRGKHVFTSLLIPFFGRLYETNAEMIMVMEIRPENRPSLNVATRRFFGHIIATKKIFTFIPGNYTFHYKNKCQFQKAGTQDKINGQYAIQELVPVCPESINQGFFRCLIRRILPPTIYKSLVYKSDNKTRLFIRCRIQYPGGFWSLDTVWYDSQMSQKELEKTLEELFIFLHSKTRKPVKIYIDIDDQRFRQLLEKRGLSFYSNMSFLVIYLKDMPRALDRLRKLNKKIDQRRRLRS